MWGGTWPAVSVGTWPARAAIRNRAGEYGENRAGECGEGLCLLSVGTWPEIKNTILTTGNDTDYKLLIIDYPFNKTSYVSRK